MAEELKDKAAKGILWSLMNNGASQLLNAIFGIVLLNILHRSDYGLIGILTVFSLVSVSIQESGFITALINRKNATHLDYNSVFWFNVVVSAFLYVLLFLCAPLIASFYNEPVLTNLARYYFFGFFISSFSIVPRAMLTKQIRQREMAFVGFFSLLLSGIVSISMAFGGLAYWGIATQTVTYCASVSVLSWHFSKWKPSLQVSMKPISEMFVFSSKMLLTNIFLQFNNHIFSLVLGKLYTKNEVGTYTQANKWNNMGSSLISGVVQSVAQPTFVQVGDDKERLCRAFSKMLRFTCFISFPVMLTLALVSHEFIMMLARAEWESSAHLMHYICVGGAFVPIATLYYNMIISRGKSNIYMWNVVAQGVVIFASILIVHYLGGGIDVMIMSFVGIVIAWIGIWHVFVYREIQYPFLSALKDIVPSFIVACVAIGVSYAVTSPFATFEPSRVSFALLFVARGAVSVVVYVGVLWLFKANILRESVGYLLHKK